MIRMRDDGALDQDSIKGGGGMWADFGYILKLQMTGSIGDQGDM